MYKAIILATALALAPNDSCESQAPPVSSSGVTKADVKVPVGANGLTVEQQNIHDRLLKDNEPGSIKYLYIISQYTGDVLMFSTVRGKVTSSGKRLTPVTVNGHWTTDNNNICGSGFAVNIGGGWYCTSEVLQDDGSYGSSSEYLYWFDSKGVYHQLGVASSLWHISDQPMAIRHTVLNLDTGRSDGEDNTAPAPPVLPTKTKK